MDADFTHFTPRKAPAAPGVGGQGEPLTASETLTCPQGQGIPGRGAGSPHGPDPTSPPGAIQALSGVSAPPHPLSDPAELILMLVLFFFI